MLDDSLCLPGRLFVAASEALNLTGVLGAASDYEDVSPHLCEGEEQGHVAADALLLQVLTRPDALPCRSNLHDHISNVCV